MFFHGPVPQILLQVSEKGNPEVTLIDSRTLELVEVIVEEFKKEERQAKRKGVQQTKVKKEGAA